MPTSLQPTLTNSNLHRRSRHPPQLNRLIPRQVIQRRLRDIEPRGGVVDGQHVDGRGVVCEFPATSALQNRLSGTYPSGREFVLEETAPGAEKER